MLLSLVLLAVASTAAMANGDCALAGPELPAAAQLSDSPQLDKAIKDFQ